MMLWLWNCCVYAMFASSCTHLVSVSEHFCLFDAQISKQYSKKNKIYFDHTCEGRPKYFVEFSPYLEGVVKS